MLVHREIKFLQIRLQCNWLLISLQRNKVVTLAYNIEGIVPSSPQVGHPSPCRGQRSPPSCHKGHRRHQAAWNRGHRCRTNRNRMHRLIRGRWQKDLDIAKVDDGE